MNFSCAVCLQPHEQILMLGCRHDPCIDCAAQHFVEEFKTQKDFQLGRKIENTYCCEICFETTQIDRASFEEIKAHAKLRTAGKMQVQEERRKCKSNSKIPNTRNRKNSKYELMLSKKTSQPKLCSTTSSQDLELFNFIKTEELQKSKRKETVKSKGMEKTVEKGHQKIHYSVVPFAKYELCERHLDEVKTYYCFQCCKNICPECVIHGEHTGHEVEVIRKASGRLRDYYKQFLLGAQKYNVILSSFTKEINTTLQTLNDWNNKQKRIIQERFRELHDTLHEKQESLLSQLIESEKISFKKLKEEQQQYQALGLSLKEKRKSLKDILVKDISAWKFADIDIRKQEIEKINRKVTELNYRRDKTKKNDIVFMKCDNVEEAIDMIEQLVQSFRLNVKNKDLEGTATFKTIS